METLFNASSINTLKTAAKISLCLLILTTVCAVNVLTQNINDDLQPKKSTVKPTPVRTRTGRPVKPRVRTATSGGRRTPNRTGEPTEKQTGNPPVENPPANGQPTNIQPPVAVPTQAQPVETRQTPEEIFERFMNFQQSAGVTSKDWESVVAQTQNSANGAQTKAQLFIAQGHIAYNRADYSTALIQFKAASQVLPDSALPFYSIGQVYLVTKQPTQAETAFARAIKLNKKLALAYKGLGDALSEQKKTKKAQDYYDDAARIGVADATSPVNAASNVPNAAATPDNKNADPTTLTANSAYELELKSARALTTQKKWQSSLDKLLPLAKENPTVETYIAVGDNYFGMEQWLSALQAYRKAIEINPASASGFYKSGLVLFETNEFQAAAEAFEKSLILDQNGMSINRQRARKMADQASEKASDLKGKGKSKRKNFLGM